MNNWTEEDKKAKKQYADFRAERHPIEPLPEQAPTQHDIAATLTERGKRYGKFTGHAEVTQEIKRAIWRRVEKRPDGTFDDDQIEALEMIAHKIGRILNGDPNYADSWVDIAGYAKLVADRLEGIER